GGTEPDGSKPVMEEPTTETDTGNDKILYGDANCDKKVNVADAVLIMQALSNPNEFELSEQGAKNADVVGNDGVTSNDALAVQMLDINLLKQSDFPLDELPVIN
ncbi:MAG: dockerin type I repeat-containing protein, partial [Muribaculaceae bacterium]|nr:dockerin type I repeat-containing protein [Muribaculaceae bacterium]